MQISYYSFLKFHCSNECTTESYIILTEGRIAWAGPGRVDN